MKFIDEQELDTLQDQVHLSLSEDPIVFEAVRRQMEVEYGPMETTLYWEGEFDGEETRAKADAMHDFYVAAENKVIVKLLKRMLEAFNESK